MKYDSFIRQSDKNMIPRCQTMARACNKLLLETKNPEAFFFMLIANTFWAA
jgi:hypothetical protein